MNKTKRTKVLYARYETAKDALGTITSKGMAIYDSQKQYLGYLPYQQFRVAKVRNINVSGYCGKAMVKLMPTLKRR